MPIYDCTCFGSFLARLEREWSFRGLPESLPGQTPPSNNPYRYRFWVEELSHNEALIYFDYGYQDGARGGHGGGPKQRGDDNEQNISEEHRARH